MIYSLETIGGHPPFFEGNYEAAQQSTTEDGIEYLFYHLHVFVDAISDKPSGRPGPNGGSLPYGQP